MKFPQYRKYKNNLSFFIIQSDTHFTEYKKLGKAWKKIEIVANILPDRNYISDMLQENSPYWDVINALEFKSFLLEIVKLDV